MCSLVDSLAEYLHLPWKEHISFASNPVLWRLKSFRGPGFRIPDGLVRSWKTGVLRWELCTCSSGAFSQNTCYLNFTKAFPQFETCPGSCSLCFSLGLVWCHLPIGHTDPAPFLFPKWWIPFHFTPWVMLFSLLGKVAPPLHVGLNAIFSGMSFLIPQDWVRLMSHVLWLH